MYRHLNQLSVFFELMPPGEGSVFAHELTFFFFLLRKENKIKTSYLRVC